MPMFLTSWFHSLGLGSPSRRTVRGTTRKRTPGRTLRLEQLEDRTVPSAGLGTSAAGVGFVAHPDYILAQPQHQATPTLHHHHMLRGASHAASPQVGQGPGGGYTPAQLQTAYGFTSISGLNSTNYNTTAGA